MTTSADFLVEIGTEELPPRALRQMADGYAQALLAEIDRAGLAHGAVRRYASPRRLAVQVEQLAARQPDRENLRRGPALSSAYDAERNPTPAALGFAKSCGVSVAELATVETGQGPRLAFRSVIKGRDTRDLLPDMVRTALGQIPIPKRMRWGTGGHEFIRPVHWAVLLFGLEVIETEVLGVQSNRASHGHRFHHPGAIPIAEPAAYPEALRARGYVLASMEERGARVRELVLEAARAHGGEAVLEEALLEEVTALVEWPVAVTGSFDRRHLELPEEVLIATLRDHQQCFPMRDPEGRLLPYFVAIGNLESRNPATVRRGHERVVEPRLADAAFFWDQDRRRPLAARLDGLRGVIYQERLGTLYDRSERLAPLAAEIALRLGETPGYAERAGRLSKCDLLTELVGEFPELQGTMGRHYALHDGEVPEIAAALEEQYLPRYAGDRLPQTRVGQCLALADRLDALIGVFGIGELPTGESDPYGLRRAGLGTLRILIEGALDLDLEELLCLAARGYGTAFEEAPLVARVFDFLMERLRGYFLDGGVSPDGFEAVLARRPTRPHDFALRIAAVAGFRALPEAASLAAANKRIANILKQAQPPPGLEIAETLLLEPAERRLAQALARVEAGSRARLQGHDYTGALRELAALREPVDGFFDTVLVMCEDTVLRDNRLALLQRVHGLFLGIADVSRLQL